MEISRSIYMEIGNNCFCKCIDCDVNDQPKGNQFINMDTIGIVMDKLEDLKVSSIRLTGYDPMSNPDLISHLTTNYPHFTYKILTTLLRWDPVILDCDEIGVSLSGVGRFYNEYFKGGKWENFHKNFNMLTRNRHNIFINTTITEVLNSQERIQELVQFLNAYQDDIKKVNIITSMTYGRKDPKAFEEMVHNELKNLQNIHLKVLPMDDVKEQSICHVGKERFYLKGNGDIYPCCMAGGELGQNLLPELKIGNIFINSIDDLRKRLASSLIVNNNICKNCTPKYYKINEHYLKH